jgi:hypothetical protein
VNKINYEKYLKEVLEQLIQSVKWLNRSYNMAEAIGIRENYRDEEFDVFENLTSRFARTTDILIQKIYRAIDRLELLEPGSLIDVANRAHKDLFKDVFEYTPKILKLVDRVEEYCKKKFFLE